MNEWPGLSDTETIFLVLAVIYLWECCCWLRGTAVCFSGASGKHRLLRSCAPLENEHGRVVFTKLMPQATSFVCQSWPIALDNEGLTLSRSPLPMAEAVEDSSNRWLPYSSIESVTNIGRDVLVNGRPIASLATVSYAMFVVERLRSLVAAKPNDRQTAIDSLLDDIGNVAVIQKRLAEFQRSTATLRSSCIVLLFYAFVVGPLMYYLPALAWWRNIWYYLAGFLACWFFTIFQYQRSRRKLHDNGASGRSGHVAMLFLSPASAMRSAESLSRELLIGFEPLAVAAAVCPADDFRSFAAATLRATLFPLDRTEETDDDAKASAWFNDRLAARQRAIVKTAGLDADTLLSEPTRSDDAAGYCPRCLRQYVMADGQCSECAGVFLKPFAEQAMATANESLQSPAVQAGQ